MHSKSDTARFIAKIVTKRADAMLDGLEFLQNKREVERLNYPVAEELYEKLTAVNKLLPAALENVAWRKETSIRQSFSKLRSEAIDESDYTVVGRKKDGKTKRSLDGI